MQRSDRTTPDERLTPDDASGPNGATLQEAASSSEGAANGEHREAAVNEAPPSHDEAALPLSPDSDNDAPTSDGAGESESTETKDAADVGVSSEERESEPQATGEPDADAQESPAREPKPDLGVSAADEPDLREAGETASIAEWARGIVVAAPAVVLTFLMTGVFYVFLLVEPSPRWVVLFGSAVAALSMDGVLRSVRREAFERGGLDTTPFLFLPALYALATPVFLEHNVRGYWALPAGALAGVGFGVLATGIVSAVRPFDAARPFGRYVSATTTYFVAFALFSLMYTFDLDVRPATIATGLVAALLAAELLRDGEIDQLETLVFAAVAGLVVAETRLAMHYLPIDGHLAALTLLLAFYFVTGLLHAHLTRQLDRAAALEYVTIAVTGLVLVVGAQAAGIA